MYGTQTVGKQKESTPWFENDVKMYGTQTNPKLFSDLPEFENDVKMYGTQTSQRKSRTWTSLRMM